MKFVGDSEPNFGGRNFREFYSKNFVGHSEPNF